MAEADMDRLKDFEKFFDLLIEYEYEDFGEVSFVEYITNLKKMMNKYRPEKYQKYYRELGD